MKFGEVIKELKIYPNKKFVNDNGVIMRRVENEIKYTAVNQSESDITLFGSGWWACDWKEYKEEDDSREFLLNIQYKDIAEQQFLKKEIIEAFRKFWKSNPSEKEFSKYMSRIVLFTEISYIMAKE